MISGTVTASDTGLPIPGARVQVGGDVAGASLERTVYSSSSGGFSFPRLPAGVFRVSVDPIRNEYFYWNYGERRPSGDGSYIQLAEGQQLTLAVSLSRGAVVTGRVLAPDGSPLTGVEVTAWRHRPASGLRRLESVKHAATDDQGVYRLFGLRPDNYYVSAAPPSGFGSVSVDDDADEIERAIRSAAIVGSPTAGRQATISVPLSSAHSSWRAPSDYLPTYAPGSTTLSGATLIALAANEVRAGVDIYVQLLRSGDIQGMLTTSIDATLSVDFWLVSDDPVNPTRWTHVRRIEPDGRFDFFSVVPGTYTLIAANRQQWGKTRVVVIGDSVVHTSVALQPSRSISGVVVFRQQQIHLTTQHLIVVARSADPHNHTLFSGHPPNGKVEPDGRFTIHGVPAGHYTLELQGSHDLKSSIVSGQDTLDFPIEFAGDHDITGAVLTLADRPSELSGSLTDSAGKPVLNYSVVAFATDSRFWRRNSRRIRKVELNHEGRFAFESLPPGSYQLAVVDPEVESLDDPEFLRALARTSIQVTMLEGNKTTQNLRVK